MPQFDPELIRVMKGVLEEVMGKVPSECLTVEIKAYLAEYILKTAAQGESSYEGLVSAATDQINVVLSLFT